MGVIEVKNIVPKLPEGVSVGEKPAIFSSRGKWISIVETLRIIDSTKCIQIKISSFNEAEIKAIIMGIRNTAKRHGLNKKIKFCQKDGILYCSTNN